MSQAVHGRPGGVGWGWGWRREGGGKWGRGRGYDDRSEKTAGDRFVRR